MLHGCLKFTILLVMYTYSVHASASSSDYALDSDVEAMEAKPTESSTKLADKKKIKKNIFHKTWRTRSQPEGVTTRNQSRNLYLRPKLRPLRPIVKHSKIEKRKRAEVIQEKARAIKKEKKEEKKRVRSQRPAESADDKRVLRTLSERRPSARYSEFFPSPKPLRAPPSSILKLTYPQPPEELVSSFQDFVDPKEWEEGLAIYFANKTYVALPLAATEELLQEQKEFTRSLVGKENLWACGLIEGYLKHVHQNGGKFRESDVQIKQVGRVNAIDGSSHHVGLGVYARRSFAELVVGVYIGEFRKVTEYTKTHFGFHLGKVPGQDGYEYILDAEKKGSITQFINHAPSEQSFEHVTANVKSYRCTLEHFGDVIGFIAQNVEEGDQLCLDYNQGKRAMKLQNGLADGLPRFPKETKDKPSRFHRIKMAKGMEE